MNAPLLVLLVAVVANGAAAGLDAARGASSRLARRRDASVAAGRGSAVALGLVLPAVGVALLDLVLGDGRGTTYDPGLQASALVAAVALAGFAAAHVVWWVLPWRGRFVASIVLLAPLALARPAIVWLAAVVGMTQARDVGVAVALVLAAVGATAVAPAVRRHWYALRPAAPQPRVTTRTGTSPGRPTAGR